MSPELFELFRSMYELTAAEARAALAPFPMPAELSSELLVGRRFGGRVEMIVGGMCIRNDVDGISLGTVYQALVPLWVASRLRVPAALFIGVAEETAIQPARAAKYAELAEHIGDGVRRMARDFAVSVEVIDTSTPAACEAIDDAASMLRIALHEEESRWLYDMHTRRDCAKPRHSPERCKASNRVIACHTHSFLTSFLGRPNVLVVEDVEQFAATRHAELSGCVGTDFLAFLPLPDLSGVRPMFQARSDQRVVINGAAIHVTDSSSLPSAVKSFYEDFALMLPVDFATTASAVDRAVAYARDVFDRHHIRRNSNMPTDMEVQIESKLDADMAAEEQSLGCTSLIAEGHIVGRRTLSGLQPSGALHLGNYFGAMQQHVEAQSDNEGFFFIASYHALTTVKDPELLRRMTRDVAVDYLAVGLDPERVALYRQTDVPQVTELSWILGCVGSMGDLERAVSYKDKVSRGIIPNIGLFTYPQLMAADILIMRAEIIPVGQDQLQHIEIARRFAFRFNRTYGDAILTIPQAKLNDAKTVAGIDGQKMSKSSGNSIPLFAEPAAVRKLIYSIRTDSAPIEAPKDPETCRVFALLKLLATPGEAVAWAERYRGGGLAYGDVKQRVFELYEARFGAARERRFELAQHPERVEEILQEGARKARHIAEAVMRDVRQAVGIPVQPCRT